ncbi:hypothetical protein BHK98_07005 [Hornefia porci]|uniref:Uncharacterized protein n=1 Tax=Hornefia porci TaxID=2652292 RepID=A0A1Q9JI78_9FIRM|nr:hypothetical protein [Hornefia porci]OLR55827.1 hypothetical protein BHK98_07005 [Hornefia porci]
MDKKAGNLGLFPKPTKKTFYSIFFEQIIIIIAVLIIYLLKIWEEPLFLMIIVSAVSSLVSSIQLLKHFPNG